MKKSAKWCWLARQNRLMLTKRRFQRRFFGSYGGTHDDGS